MIKKRGNGEEGKEEQRGRGKGQLTFLPLPPAAVEMRACTAFRAVVKVAAREGSIFISGEA